MNWGRVLWFLVNIEEVQLSVVGKLEWIDVENEVSLCFISVSWEGCGVV